MPKPLQPNNADTPQYGQNYYKVYNKWTRLIDGAMAMGSIVGFRWGDGNGDRLLGFGKLNPTYAISCAQP